MSRSKILVVEDEVMVAMTLEDTLEALGYEVAGTADNGEDAIRLATEKNPDLILMDIRIRGDIDGVEVAERISETLDIPVVFLTAHSDEQTLMRALKTQPYGFLIKPFRERELYSNIEMAMHKHRVLKKRGVAAQLAREMPKPAPAATPKHETEAPVSAPADISKVVVESLETPLFILNRDLKIILYNKKFTELCSALGIPETYFRASAEKAGIFPLLGSANDYRAVLRENSGDVFYHDVRAGSMDRYLKISRTPLKDKSGFTGILAIVDDVTYEKKLRESGDIYHRTAESVTNLSKELKDALKDHEDPRLREIAETSDDMILRFSRMDEEWIRIRNDQNMKKIWEL